MDGWADENWNGIVQDEETWIDVRISNFKEIYDRGNGLFLSDDDKEETKKHFRERSTDGISCCDSRCGNIMTFIFQSFFIAAGCLRF
jgi:hypothetical protein